MALFTAHEILRLARIILVVIGVRDKFENLANCTIIIISIESFTISGYFFCFKITKI